MERIVAVRREEALIVLENLKAVILCVDISLLHEPDLLYLSLVGLESLGSNVGHQLLLRDAVLEVDLPQESSIDISLKFVVDLCRPLSKRISALGSKCLSVSDI
jgi:hypothetical protein